MHAQLNLGIQCKGKYLYIGIFHNTEWKSDTVIKCMHILIILQYNIFLQTEQWGTKPWWQNTSLCVNDLIILIGVVAIFFRKGNISHEKVWYE